jgi:hypothetical protein
MLDDAIARIRAEGKPTEAAKRVWPRYRIGRQCLTKPRRRQIVLPNAGVAAFEREKRVPVTSSPLSSQDAEQLAIEVAIRENEEQGLSPLTVAKQTDKDASLTVRTASIKTLRTPNAAVRPLKVKRVAKVKARGTIPQGRDALASAYGRAFAPFDGFDSWSR